MQNSKFFFSLFLLFFIVGCFYSSFYIVETGQQGAISRLGKFTTVVDEGLHFKIPFIEKVEIITVRNTLYEYPSLEVSTKDMQSILLNLSVQINIRDLETLYKKYKTSYKNSLIDPRVREIVNANISRYTIEHFVSKRQELSQNIYNALKQDLADDGLEINNVSIVNHDFSDKYEKAVEDKKIAEQEVETTKFIQEKAKVQMQNKVELARIEAENKVTLAKYHLEEKKLQAEANKVESESLSPQLLNKLQLEKWNGILPQVMNNDSNGLIYNLNK